MANKSTAGLFFWGINSGIRKDIDIISRELEASGIGVRTFSTRDRGSRCERILKWGMRVPRLLFPLDLQIHLEQIHREQVPFGRVNLFFINPEWTDPDIFRKLHNRTWVACKSHHARQLMEGRHNRLLFTGFSSTDYHDAVEVKDYGRFLHAPGKSDYKGTDILYNVWKRHPEWPKLTIVWPPKGHYGQKRRDYATTDNIELIREWLTEPELRSLMNQCGVHLCLSQMEGFGHYLVEGMSTGAVVVTTDAAPMNEHVRPERGYLVEVRQCGEHFMSTRVQVCPEALETTLQRIIETPASELRKTGQQARSWFLENDALFRERMKQLLQNIDQLDLHMK